MKTQGTHAHEDRLLDFAYDELPPTEARLVEQHVQGCSRCSETLAGIRGVRTTMSRLPLESAPDAGLESLLAYAQQSARRSAAGPEPAPRWWRRLLAPVLSVAALSVFGIVVVQVNREVDLSPALVQQKESPREKTRSREEQPEMVADAAAVPAPMPPATSAPVPADIGKVNAEMDEEMRAATPATRMPTKAAPKKGLMRNSLREDWSNMGAGSAGGFPDKKLALNSDDEASGLDVLGSKESKRKRDAIGGTALPSVSPAQSSAPAEEAPAEYASASESQAVQAAPPEPQQMIRGSASRPAAVARKDIAQDDAYAQQAPGRAQVATASPPPPPPAAPAQYQPSAGAAGPVAQAEGLKSEAAQKPATRLSPSPAELMNQAEVANRSGDWAQEVAFLRAALSAGVRGSQRLEVMSRLCDAEFALGRRQIAVQVCKGVVAEAPGSSAARTAQRRLESELESSVDELDSDQKASTPAKK